MQKISSFHWGLLGAGALLLTVGSDGILWAGETATTASGTPEFLGNLPPEVQFAITTLGFGGISGWCVGFTLKKFAKLMALLVGTILIAIQFLAFHKFIAIDWERIQTAVPDSTLQQLWMGLMSVITYNMPFAGAFAAGLFLGFRSG